MCRTAWSPRAAWKTRISMAVSPARNEALAPSCHVVRITGQSSFQQAFLEYGARSHAGDHDHPIARRTEEQQAMRPSQAVVCTMRRVINGAPTAQLAGHGRALLGPRRSDARRMAAGPARHAAP